MYCCQMPSQMQVAPNAEWKGAVQELQTGRWSSSSISLFILKGWKQQNSQSQYGSKFYLNVFRAPALCLVGCDEDVGGDEERPVLGGRNHIVSFIPHSVEPLVRILILWFWLVKEIFQTRRCRLSRWLLSPSPATDMRNVEGTLKNKPYEENWSSEIWNTRQMTKHINAQTNVKNLQTDKLKTNDCSEFSSYFCNHTGFNWGCFLNWLF